MTEGKCTVRCVGVPPHTKESSLFRHFRQYGTVVKMEYIDESKGTWRFGILVQFLSAKTAQKCLASPSAVLNNRHVSLALADINLVPEAEAQEYVDQAQTRGYMDGGSGGYDGYGGRGGGGRSRGRGRGRFAAQVGFRDGWGGRTPYAGRSSYYSYSVAGRGRGGAVSTASSYVRGAEASEDSPGNSSSIVTPAPVVAEVALPSSYSSEITKRSADKDEGGGCLKLGMTARTCTAT